MRNLRIIPPLFLLFVQPALAVDVNVVGLFSGKAVLVVNGGPPRTLSAGQITPEGVRLISATSQSAVVEIAGERRTLAPGQSTHIGSRAMGSGPAQVILTADARGHFVTTGTINGISVRMLVDTGATTMALPAGEARRLGINYLAGTRAYSQTANGLVPVYRVKLDSVRLGDVTANNVDAVVIEGDALPIALLGMSFLNRMEMKRDGMTMTLIRRY
ncbi:MAG: TIGR02281 family clan AA aspartic protease [Burkholderiales bacterium]|nr:TIGR02281 family clan AA aspartic protease [Burkholderiales bacterium]